MNNTTKKQTRKREEKASQVYIKNFKHKANREGGSLIFGKNNSFYRGGGCKRKKKKKRPQRKAVKTNSKPCGRQHHISDRERSPRSRAAAVVVIVRGKGWKRDGSW